MATDVYPIGRLDKDSEGLLLLSNDPSLNGLLLNPKQEHQRTYLIQVDGDLDTEAVSKLKLGVEIKLTQGTYKTQPCEVKKLSKPPVLPERNPPIRYRANIPTSWAAIDLSEGKNRQVRKMLASVGYPVLRLVRVQIEDLKLGKLQPGHYFEIKPEELFRLLKIPMPKYQPQPKLEKKAPISTKKVAPTPKKKSYKDYRKKK